MWSSRPERRTGAMARAEEEPGQCARAGAVAASPVRRGSGHAQNCQMRLWGVCYAKFGGKMAAKGAARAADGRFPMI